MTVLEQVAHLLGRYVVTFPARPRAWFDDTLLHPVGALASGAFAGAVVGWILDRREQGDDGPASTTDPS